MIAGVNGWEDMENYGLSKYKWLEQFLALSEGIPSADTFRRVFERIKPKVFEQCFRRWVESIVKTVGAQVIPIDGKTLKGSYDRVLGKTALHLVSAWSSEYRHRTEKRSCWCVPISQLPPLHNHSDWLGLKCVVMVVRVRHLWNKTTREVQFYLTSLNCDAHKLGQAIRLHWGVENGLHWTLDVTFNEYACRVRTGHAPQNLSLLRRIALNALNLEQSFKRSNRQKLNRAAMDNNYMLTILAACLSQYNDTSKSACQ